MHTPTIPGMPPQTEPLINIAHTSSAGSEHDNATKKNELDLETPEVESGKISLVDDKEAGYEGEPGETDDVGNLTESQSMGDGGEEGTRPTLVTTTSHRIRAATPYPAFLSETASASQKDESSPSPSPSPSQAGGTNAADIPQPRMRIPYVPPGTPPFKVTYGWHPTAYTYSGTNKPLNDDMHDDLDRPFGCWGADKEWSEIEENLPSPRRSASPEKEGPVASASLKKTKVRRRGSPGPSHNNGGGDDSDEEVTLRRRIKRRRLNSNPNVTPFGSPRRPQAVPLTPPKSPRRPRIPRSRKRTTK